jgi:hypothetical protein
MIESGQIGHDTSTHGRKEAATSHSVPIEIAVQEGIDNEIATLRLRQQESDDRAWQLQEEVDAASAKFDETGHADDQARYNNLHRALMRAINNGTAISEKIKELRHPSTFEKRVQERIDNQRSIKRLKGATQMAKETAKDQGVPEVYLNEETGTFRIGMDARLKSDLVNSALGLITKDDPGDSLMIFDEKEAVELLEKREWTGFLDRKREIVETKAARKAENEAKREEAARERAEAKAAKEAEKEAERQRKAEEKAAADAAKAEKAAASKASTKASTSKGTSKTDQLRAQREAQAAAKS